MKLRLAAPEYLIDIDPLAGELGYIRDARRRAPDRRDDPPPRRCSSRRCSPRLAIFTDAERVIADPVVRNRGTIGGALCQADPSEDLSAVCAAVGARLVIRGARRRARRRHARVPPRALRDRGRPGRDADRDPRPAAAAPAAPTRRSTAASATGRSSPPAPRSTLDATARSPAPGIALAAVGGDITSPEAERRSRAEPPPDALFAQRRRARARPRASRSPTSAGRRSTSATSSAS